MSDPREKAREILGIGNARATQQDIEIALAKASVAVLDAQEEVVHWRSAFGVVQNEMKFLLATFMRKGCKAGSRKLIVSLADLRDLDASWEVHVGSPEDGVRTYELRRRRGKEKSLIDRVN